MTQLRVAIIGCGNVSSVHLAAAGSNPLAQLIAVCDVKPDRAQAAGEKYSVPYFTDYHDVLAQKPDVIHVCTPHHTHAEITIAACEQGINVLTEKPMAVSLHDADRMIKAAADNKVTLGVIFQNRYNPASVAVKQAVESGRLGRVKGARMFLTWYRPDEYYSQSDWKGTWDQEGGGVLIDQAIHTMDLMQWIVGDIDYLKASMANRTHHIIDVEDVAEATIHFKNGAIGSLYACNYYTYDADILLEVPEELGTARIEKIKPGFAFAGQPDQWVFAEGDHEVVGKSCWESATSEIDEYYRDVLAGRPVTIDGSKGVGPRVCTCLLLRWYNWRSGTVPLRRTLSFTPPSLTE